jgi:hypothetical protein
MDYYDKYQEEYIEATLSLDMTQQYQSFLKHLDKGSKILDIGFGSGRDMIYFSSLGYEVSGIDTCNAFVCRMKELGYSVKLQNVQSLEERDCYDALWACASLLHVSSEELTEVFMRCHSILKRNGLMYCSFKYGDFEGVKDQRHYLYLTEKTILNYLPASLFKVLEIYITSGQKKGQESTKWLNVILKKK